MKYLLSRPVLVLMMFVSWGCHLEDKDLHQGKINAMTSNQVVELLDDDDAASGAPARLHDVAALHLRVGDVVERSPYSLARMLAEPTRVKRACAIPPWHLAPASPRACAVQMASPTKSSPAA